MYNCSCPPTCVAIYCMLFFFSSCIEKGAVEVGRNSNNSSDNFTIVIIAGSVAGLIIIFAIIVAVVAMHYECRKPKVRMPNRPSGSYNYL